ncbi:hypothetical protein G6F24_017047 [Rhizopus arrhizus]|nr:hypothetical protein G6F24_017047 [Rhizopus arrhizus]
MAHQVDAQGGTVRQFLVQVGGDAPVVVGAQSAGQLVEGTRAGFLAGQVDAAAHGRHAGLDGARALEHFGLFQVEDIGAAG